jgi:hypothetical protein
MTAEWFCGSQVVPSGSGTGRRWGGSRFPLSREGNGTAPLRREGRRFGDEWFRNRSHTSLPGTPTPAAPRRSA